MHDDTLIGTVLGLFIGGLVTLAVIDYRDNKPTGWQGMKAECEKSIPRDQHCKMQWVPDVKVK